MTKEHTEFRVTRAAAPTVSKLWTVDCEECGETWEAGTRDLSDTMEDHIAGAGEDGEERNWSVDCTAPSQVVEYLTAEYHIDRADAEAMVVAHKQIVDQGIGVRSHVDYVGTEVVEAGEKA